MNVLEFILAAMERNQLLSKQKMEQAFKLFDLVNPFSPLVAHKHDDLEWRWIYFKRGTRECYGRN